MERREFVKRVGVLGIGFGGLVGLERLVKALAGEPAYADTPAPQCGPDNNNVTCSGVHTSQPNYQCDNYQCNSNFVCQDFTCFQNGVGDFDCHSAFDCAINQTGSQFQCDGSDVIGTQFNCSTPFRCFPGGSGTGTQRFYCDDFYCQEGQFECHGKYDTCVGLYSA
jgi:hypothetical protein